MQQQSEYCNFWTIRWYFFLLNLDPKLQALVYDILPSTTAVFSYAIGSRKLSANEQFLVGAQTVVSLLQTTQIKQGVSFIAANKVYTSANKTTIVWIETELFCFTRGGCVSCLRVCFGARLLPQSYQYPNLSEGADRVGGQLRGDKECPFSGITKSGRVWRKVPESGARSVPWPLCCIVGSTLSVNNIWQKNDNDCFEPELVITSDWNRNCIPSQIDQWYFLGNWQRTWSQKWDFL